MDQSPTKENTDQKSGNSESSINSYYIEMYDNWTILDKKNSD